MSGKLLLPRRKFLILAGTALAAPAVHANRGFNGRCPKSAAWIGTSITLAVRTGVVANQALAWLVSQSKGYYPYNNFGVAGTTSVNGLAIIEQVLAVGPSMLSIEFGTNDPFNSVPVGAIGTAGSYMDNMSQMIVKGQRIGAAVTIWVPLFSPTSSADATIAPYRTAARSLASTYGCNLFDTYADMAAWSPSTQTANFIQTDNPIVHLTSAGNAAAAAFVGTVTSNMDYTNSFVSA